MAKIIVTGGAGFIGSHLVDALIGQSHHVLVVDDLSSGLRQNIHQQAKFIKLDIRSSKLRSAFSRFKPHYVFHLAAQKNVRTSIENPVLDADINIAGALNVITASHSVHVKKFIFSSTGGALYGDGVPLPTPETVPPKPESPYGIAKLTVEQYLNFFRRVHGLNSVSLRYANVYGPRQDPNGEAGVVAIFAQRLLQGQPLFVNGHGRQTRDYVYVDDVVRANLQSMKKQNVSGEINIGTGKETSVNTLAENLLRISQSHTPIKHRPALLGEVKRSSLEWGLAEKRLHWEPLVSFPHGLQNTWSWVQEMQA